MSIAENLPVTAQDYDRAAEEYYLSLPLEHFMEAIPQAVQREITLESFALLKTRRRNFQYFSELLVQYIHAGQLRQVVPDNFVILSEAPPSRAGSYPLALEAARPFIVLEYVSEGSQKKDYEDRFENYERELKTPYCLHFHPERQDLRVYRHDGQRYVRLEPDLRGRIAIPELELEVGLHEEWVRYWHRGELLELPAELDRRMTELSAQLKEQAAQIESQERKLASQDRKLASQDRKLASQDRKLADLDETVQVQSTKIGELQSHVEDVVARLRRAVERSAQKAGRTDILAQLASTSDVAQLDRWLEELEA